jgi:hypothetical protein
MSGTIRKCQYCWDEWDNQLKDDCNPHSVLWGLCPLCTALLDNYRGKKRGEVVDKQTNER